MIEISNREAEDIVEFIRNTLYRDWDRYTDNYIVINTTNEQGMCRMNPTMYEFAKELQRKIDDASTST